MTFGELASQWMYRKLNDEFFVAGLQVFWWQRLAKLTQFIAGSVIVIEIVGIERIRSAGRHLDNIFSWQKIFAWPKTLHKALAVFRASRDLYFAPNLEPKEIVDREFIAHSGRTIAATYKPNPNYSEARNREIEAHRRDLEDHYRQAKNLPGLGFFWWIPGTLGCLFSTYLFYEYVWLNSGGVTAVWMLWLFILAPLFYIVNFLFLFMAASIIRIPFVVVGALLIDPLGKILASEKFKETVLLISFILLVFSFLTDIAFS